MEACAMYAADNHDKFAQNLQGGAAQGGNFPPASGPGWAAGWLDWTAGPDNTNLLFLVNDRYASLARYAGAKPSVFKCPLDRSLSSVQQARGWVARVRSYSASVGIGQGNAESGSWDNLYRHVTNITDLLYPSPSQTLVYLDENSDSINDPAFYSPVRTSLVDTPAARHEGGAGVSFADGHAEIHKWTGSVSRRGGGPGDPDLHWLSWHTQRNSISSY